MTARYPNPTIDDLLADSVTQIMMKRDGVEECFVRELMRHVASSARIFEHLTAHAPPDKNNLTERLTACIAPDEYVDAASVA